LIGRCREILGDGQRWLREPSIPKQSGPEFPPGPYMIGHWEDRALDGCSRHAGLMRSPNAKSLEVFQNLQK